MRRISLDVPTMESRRRLGRIRAQVTEKLYTVVIGNSTVSASTFEPSAIVRGEAVQVAWHPERNFWEIERVAEAIIRSGFLIQYFAVNGGGPFATTTYDGGDTYPDNFDVFDPVAGGHETSDLYYERWNGTLHPITGLPLPNRVHFMQQAGNDGLFYRHADLASGVPVLGTLIDLGINYAPFGVKGSSIIVTPNGRVRIDGFSIGGGPTGGRSHYSDDYATFSAALANTPMEAQRDRMIGWHDRSTGLDDSTIYLYYDESATQLSVKRGTAVGGALTETTFGSTVTWADEIGGANWAATMNGNGDGHISLVVWTSDVFATSKSLQAWDIFGATITAKTDVITSETHVNLCALARLPSALGPTTLRVFYTKRGALSGDNVSIYYKDSIDEMDTWGTETLWITDPSPAGSLIDKLGIDPLPGIGPQEEEASPWWLRVLSDEVISEVYQRANGVAVVALGGEAIDTRRERAGTTRGQVAWIAVP